MQPSQCEIDMALCKGNGYAGSPWRLRRGREGQPLLLHFRSLLFDLLDHVLGHTLLVTLPIERALSRDCAKLDVGNTTDC